jgi:hypothetical protein
MEPPAAAAKPEREPERPPSAGRSAGATTTFAALYALLFLLLRLMAVAHYNWDTAFDLADTVDFSDTLSVIVGTVFGSNAVAAYVLAVLLPLVIVGHVRRQLRERHPIGVVVVLGVAVMFAAAVLTFRLWGALIVAGVCGVGVAAAEWRGGPALRLMRQLMGKVWLLAVVAVLVAAAVTDEVWVPEEHLVVHGHIVTGYVMDVSPGFITVLTSPGRDVIYLPTTSVSARLP